jgi:hypothetical protein
MSAIDPLAARRFAERLGAKGVTMLDAAISGGTHGDPVGNRRRPSRDPTGATTNTGFNIDEVNGGLIKPAVALTAIGADLETGRATP